MEVLPSLLLERARRLRHNQTKAERILWAIVRNRQFGGYKFRRQKPIGPYGYDQQRDDYLPKKDILGHR